MHFSPLNGWLPFYIGHAGFLFILFFVLMFFIVVVSRAKKEYVESNGTTEERNSFKYVLEKTVDPNELLQLEEEQKYESFPGEENEGVEISTRDEGVRVSNAKSVQEMQILINEQIAKVAAVSKGNTPSKNPADIAETKKLQDLARELVVARYGPEPYQLEIELEFPATMADFEVSGPEGKFVIEMGSLKDVPYSVYIFLEVMRTFKSGAFHRMAGHVTQALVRTTKDGPSGMAFQEYSDQYPHIKRSLGYAGRPGGPEFYISLVDNTMNHGPGSQGSKTEADGCFARVIDGWESVVEKRLKKQPGGNPKTGGFIGDNKNFIRIKSIGMKSHS